MKFDLSNRDTIFASLPRNGVGAEIGVYSGIFSAVILQQAEPRLLFLIDCWITQSVEIHGHDTSNARQEIKNAFYQQVFRTYLTDDRVRVFKAFSQEAAPMFPDAFFDWVFLDANHLQCYRDIQAWWPKVKPGGWLMGHDYVTGGVADFVTVQADVDRWVAETGLPLLLTDDPIWKCWIVEKPL